MEYEKEEVVQYVPRERKVTDYYAVEYQTEQVPQVFQKKYTEYVPVDRYKERVEYYPVERQVAHVLFLVYSILVICLTTSCSINFIMYTLLKIKLIVLVVNSQISMLALLKLKTIISTLIQVLCNI